MTAASLPAMTLAEADALLRSIGWRPEWTETDLNAATSKFGPLKFDGVKRAIAITHNPMRAAGSARPVARTMPQGSTPDA